MIADEDVAHSGRVSVRRADLNVNSQSDSLGPLQRYRIVAPLGKGGMAEVFLAAWEVAPHVQRPVVVKRLYAHLGDDPNLVQMFIDEARLACGLEHEHIVKTIEVGVIDDHCCIAMEYLAGQSLQQVLRHGWSRGGVPIEVALHVAVRALDALGYAHEFKDHRGTSMEIVHRDISPHNIFITNAGCVKLLDFGIAKATNSESRTATGYIKGKLAYFAPEQARAQSVDGRADIWSVGVVLWEMLSGTRLFRAETDVSTLTATLEKQITPPSSLRSGIAPELDRIVMRALQRDVSVRYSSARDMRLDLERVALQTGRRTTTGSLARLMQDYFAQEIIRQRKMVFDLLEHDMTSTGRSSQTPTAVRATSVTTRALAVDPSREDESLIRAKRNQKRLVWTLVAALLLTTTVGAFAMCLLVLQNRPSPPIEPTRVPPVPARAAEELRAKPDRADESTHASAMLTSGAAEPAQPSAPSTGTQAPPPVTPVASARRTASHGRTRPAPTQATSTSPSVSGETGQLSLDSSPWSLVSMEGKLLGQTPLLGVRLSPGTHVLTLKNPELGLETQYAVTIEAGKTVARRVGLR
jgi:serine/threonine-protein kinase